MGFDNIGATWWCIVWIFAFIVFFYGIMGLVCFYYYFAYLFTIIGCIIWGSGYILFDLRNDWFVLGF